MSKSKAERNEKIFSDYLAGKSVYAIAHEHGISWPRARAILYQKGVYKRNSVSLDGAANNHHQRARLNYFCKTRGIKNLPCQVCGTFQKIEKHHVDYDNPFLVIFLCRKHHHIYHETDKSILDGIEPIDVRKLQTKGTEK